MMKILNINESSSEVKYIPLKCYREISNQLLIVLAFQSLLTSDRAPTRPKEFFQVQHGETMSLLGFTHKNIDDLRTAVSPKSLPPAWMTASYSCIDGISYPQYHFQITFHFLYSIKP